jgi:hypothetical protein
MGVLSPKKIQTKSYLWFILAITLQIKYFLGCIKVIAVGSCDGNQFEHLFAPFYEF